MELDFSTQSNPDHVQATHASINLTVDFDKTRLHGTVTWSWTKVGVASNSEFILDAKGLSVSSVVDEHGTDLVWEFGAEHKVFGTPLKIKLPASATTGKACISYETSPESSALQWLTPAQTGGKKLPFLFSQCQAIHARSMIPCQDTPMVKATYDAVVTAPATTTVLMSALGNGDEPTIDGELKTFKFNQPVAMAAYLIAIACGDLVREKVGPRTGVWAEPGVVKAVAYEFGEMEQMVEAGEQVCGPYVWGVYDVLCMPPSFPYGGMENPCLTFVTPTLLAGDRSLATVVIHEITHSWTGNLVTNRSWSHFWLNEGWTMFVQRKIMEIMVGSSTAELDALIGVSGLSATVDHFGCDHNFTALIPDLSGGVDPDDAFSRIPYEKGFNFLTYLQETAGGKDAFKPFILEYIKTFSHKTLTSIDFKNFYLDFFKDKNVDVSKIDWEKWLYGAGMPPVANKFDDSLRLRVLDLKDKWLQTKGEGCSASDIEGFTTAQFVTFLTLLGGDDCKETLVTDHEILIKMDSLYGFTNTGNCEIKFGWQMICIKAELESILPAVVDFVKSQGRMKYVRPLYSALFKSKMGKETAVSTFAENMDIYHPIASKMLAKDLSLCVPV